MATAAIAMPEFRQIIWPSGNIKSLSYGGPREIRTFDPTTNLWMEHQSHIHVSIYSLLEQGGP